MLTAWIHNHRKMHWSHRTQWLMPTKVTFYLLNTQLPVRISLHRTCHWVWPYDDYWWRQKMTQRHPAGMTLVIKRGSMRKSLFSWLSAQQRFSSSSRLTWALPPKSSVLHHILASDSWVCKGELNTGKEIAGRKYLCATTVTSSALFRNMSSLLYKQHTMFCYWE